MLGLVMRERKSVGIFKLRYLNNKMFRHTLGGNQR
jgi:hypothetical protein